MFLQLPELSTVGTPQERAAFIALRVEGRTVREVGQAIGVSKSGVNKLAELFQHKLKRKMIEVGRKRDTCSPEFRRLRAELLELFLDHDDWAGKIGSFDPHTYSREDWAECRTGVRLKFDDE